MRIHPQLGLQHKVQLEVESTDKNGNFVGYLFVSPDGNISRAINMREALVEAELVSLHFTAEHSGHYNALLAAGNRAKNAKKNIWTNNTEEQQQEETCEDTILQTHYPSTIDFAIPRFLGPDKENVDAVLDAPMFSASCVEIETLNDTKKSRPGTSFVYALKNLKTAGVDSEGFCILKAQGYFRGLMWSANNLVHLPGFGDFQISHMELVVDPLKASMNDAEKEIRRVPNGTFRYKSAWILEDSVARNTTASQMIFDGGLTIYKSTCQDQKGRNMRIDAQS
ncbi:hypothetical protein GCK72_026049 [Caenorhabditis remanei]|uniref:AARP2CN domain-containing protein n=1 Tax=Caenorhabditis remanei TaxID=31234 RepID=A0A6A5G4D1_CAERE|nr:hypothetical protein GCK72_026049 [Caenorhabditis remanei]KAF1749581.1 hypothetical protein GCK72_026049 [Caenorhabditis remanei]